MSTPLPDPVRTGLSPSDPAFVALFDRNPQPMWICATDSLAILAVNEAAMAHYGYSEDEFLSLCLHDLGPVSGDGGREPEAWSAAHLTRDGREVSMEFRATGIVFEGRPARLVVAHDVTERRDAEAALRESEERFRHLVEQSLAGIYIVQDGRLAYVSPRFAESLGYSPEELSSRPDLLDLIEEADRTQVREAIARRMEGQGGRQSTDFRMRRRDGALVEIEAHGNLTTLQGRPAIIGVLLDVTERRQAERELLESNAQLLQAQKMEAVGRLAGAVAHDFNNLLQVITGFTSLLQLDADPESDASRDLLEIQKAADRATALARQLLAFSRKQVLHPELLSINDRVRDAERMLRRLIGEDIELRVDLADDAGQVRVDPAQIGQVLLNLAVNSRDAMPRGGRLSITTRRVELRRPAAGFPDDVPPGTYACIHVRDSGCGMDAATLERIFEPFYTTKEPGKGTGLGLSTVYGILRQSGGFVCVHTAPSEGSEFAIYLPCHDADPAPRRRSTGPDPGLRGTGTVLVVEDEDAVRSLALRVLRGAGYRVLAARDGHDALALAQRHPQPIDLLLTDVVLPGISGKELADRLEVHYPRMRRLYISGYFGDRLEEYGVDEGRAPLLRKPFRPTTLLGRIRDLLLQA